MAAGVGYDDLSGGAGPRTLAPVRVGIDNRTGKVLIGWPHTEQNIGRLFTCRFHERVLVRWLGSLVPHLLGENATRNNILRYFSAIATAIDLWEPCFRVVYVNVCDLQGNILDVATIANRLRVGKIAFRVRGNYMPRGHLGDFTVESVRDIYFVGTGSGVIEKLQI
jgi:phage baseplate assembly protein W